MNAEVIGMEAGHLATRQQHASEMCEHWKFLGNKALERGERAKAERHFDKAQVWLDRLNELEGRS